MQSHDTLKPIKSFICNRCGMTFGQQAHLTQHISEDHHRKIISDLQMIPEL